MLNLKLKNARAREAELLRLGWKAKGIIAKHTQFVKLERMGNILSDDDIKSSISSSLCRVCGKASEGYKCPKCGKEADSFDPFHWKDCEHRAKMETKCKACQRAEGICTCLKHK